MIKVFLLIMGVLGGSLAWAAGTDDGLLAHYRLDGDASDSWTNSLDGVNAGAVSATNRFGAPAKALHFDGSNDLLNFGMSSAWIFGTNSFSVLFWFKTDSIATRKVGLVTLQNGGGDIKFSIGYGGAWATPEADGDKLGLGINYSPGIWGVDVTGVTSLADSEWHHVALTRYENEWTLYLDGHPEQGVSVSYPYSSGSGTLLVGAHVVGDRYFQGDIDDVRIYSRALSQETISTLADQPIVHIQTAVEIKWLSTSNIVYQVQWADSLQTNVWNDLGNPIIGDGSIKNIFDSTHLIQKRYYRVLLP